MQESREKLRAGIDWRFNSRPLIELAPAVPLLAWLADRREAPFADRASGDAIAACPVARFTLGARHADRLRRVRQLLEGDRAAVGAGSKNLLRMRGDIHRMLNAHVANVRRRIPVLSDQQATTPAGSELSRVSYRVPPREAGTSLADASPVAGSSLMSVTAPSHRPVCLLLFAALISGSGRGVAWVAFPWLVLHRTGSALAASIVAGAAAVPMLFSGLIAGTAVDLLGRKRVSILSDLLSGLTMAAIPLLALTLGKDALNVGVLAVTATVGALIDPAGITARKSMLPEAAARAGWTLDRANALSEAMIGVAFVVGPGLGGVAIAMIGGINTMWLTATAFPLSMLAVSSVRLAGAGRPDRQIQPENPRAGTTDGVRFVWNTRVLRALVVIDMAINGLYMPTECVLFPKYFADRNEPAHLSWVLMALSCGGLIGALAYPLMIRRRTRRSTLLTAALTVGVCTAVISLLPPVEVILPLCSVMGVVLGPVVPIYNYAMQTKSPAHLRGRVVGVMSSLGYAARPAGFMLAGPLATAFGLRTTFLVLAIPIMAVGLVSLRLPALRELDRSQRADASHDVATDAPPRSQLAAYSPKRSLALVLALAVFGERTLARRRSGADLIPVFA